MMEHRRQVWERQAAPAKEARSHLGCRGLAPFLEGVEPSELDEWDAEREGC